MDLRIATIDDFDQVKRMALNFYRASPYSNIKIDDGTVDDTIRTLILNSGAERTVILSLHNDNPVGIIAGTVQPFLFNKDRVASELMWWMDEEHRKGRKSLQLLNAFEYWAKSVAKCDMILLSTIDSLQSDRIGRVYEKRGYRPAENNYYLRVT
jgi:hypothetical protein